MMIFPKKRVFAAAVLLALFCAVLGLFPRWTAERKNRSAAILVDYRDLVDLAGRENMKIENILLRLRQSGVAGLMVSELKGNDLRGGAMSLKFVTLSSLPEDIRSRIDGTPDQAVLYFPAGGDLLEKLETYIKIKFPQATFYKFSRSNIVLLPARMADLAEAGVVPDIAGLELADRKGIRIVYRPAPFQSGDPAAIAEVVDEIAGKFSTIAALAPSGEVVVGYPHLGGLSEVLKRRELSLAQVEFSRQIGAVNLNWMSFPELLSLHSVTAEEILSRRISRMVLTERMVRAATERSVRLLLLRPTKLRVSSKPANEFEDEVATLSKKLISRGMSMTWPATFGMWSRSPFSAMALAIILILTFFSLVMRFISPEAEKITTVQLFCLVLATVFLAAGGYLFPGFARIAGAFCAAFLASESALIALEGWRKPGRALLLGVAVAVVGGLAIAAFFSLPEYMLRLRTFSGVKLTLFLPLIIVLLHDLKNRVHPESLIQIMVRPPLWGELLLLGFMLMAAAVVLFRSGNVSFVPGWEIRIRDLLEKLLVARPRNKEIFAGYPALILWYYFRRNDLWSRYREVFRLGSTLAFSSMVNSFCHFHTRLYFILLRVFNGCWSGVFVGLVLTAVFVFIARPLWRRWNGVFLD